MCTTEDPAILVFWSCTVEKDWASFCPSKQCLSEKVLKNIFSGQVLNALRILKKVGELALFSFGRSRVEKF